MDEQLRDLLDYDGVLTAVASSEDGLVVGTAGLSGDDAEIVAAGGTTLLAELRERGEQSGYLDVAGGRLHVIRGAEISLLLLTEPTIHHEAIAGLMQESLEQVAGVLS